MLLVLVVESAARAQLPPRAADDPLRLTPPLASSPQCGFLAECGRFDAIGLHVANTLGLRGSRDRSFAAVSDWVRLSLTLLDVVEAGGALGGHFTHDEQGAGHLAGAAARLFVRGRLYPLPWVKLSSAGWVMSASYERSFVSQKLGAEEPPGFDTNTARLTLSRSFWRIELDGGAGVVFANPPGGRYVTLDLYASIGLNLFIDPNEPAERLKLMLQAVYRPPLARPDGMPSLQESYVLAGVEARTASGYHVGLGLGPHVLGSRAGALLLLNISASWGPRYKNPVMVRLNELGRRVPRLWMDLFYVDPVLEADGCIWSDPVPDAPRLRIICVGSPDARDPNIIRLWDGRSLPVGTHLWIDKAGGLLTDKQESVAKLDPETLKGALAAQKLAQELKEVADCTETYALRKLPLPDELRMFTDQPAAVGLMYAALEANRLRQCQASGQVKGQSALSWLMLLGKLNPAGKGTRAGPGFSAGPKGKEQEAEHIRPAVVPVRQPLSDKGRAHIFYGELDKRAESKGWHFEPSADPKRGTYVIENTRSAVDKHGVYEANVMIEGVKKKARSTFFPKDWTEQQVEAVILEAYKNRVPIPKGPGNRFQGKTSAGIEVTVDLDGDGNILTAFPTWEKGRP